MEGDKDADRLAGPKLPATCNAAGAGKWRDEYTAQLKAASVERAVIFPDNDDIGRKHAEQVARSCQAAGLQVKIVTLPDLPPKPHGGRRVLKRSRRGTGQAPRRTARSRFPNLSLRNRSK